MTPMCVKDTHPSSWGYLPIQLGVPTHSAGGTYPFRWGTYPFRWEYLSIHKS